MTAFDATFSDFRLVKTRKVAQFIFETPIEAADSALAALGGVPRADTERWVGIAPITHEAASQPRREMTLSQRAGMLCQDAKFQEFIAYEQGHLAEQIGDIEAACYVRSTCNVTTRADIKPGTEAGEAFEALVTEYDAWRGKIGSLDRQ